MPPGSFLAGMGARELAVLTAAIALMAAAIYVTMAAVRIYVTGTFANVSRDLVWMSPISNLLWYFAGWVLLAAVMRVIGARGFMFGVSALLMVFSFSLFLRFTAISRLAALIFSAGLASALARRIRLAADAWLHRARVMALVLASGFAVSTGYVLLRRALTTRELPPAAQASPNVILLVLDTMRDDVLRVDSSGSPVAPFLDSLARHGAHFTNAFSTAPWTLPSHGSMFTGEYPIRLDGTLLTPLVETPPTIGEQFSALGYYTFGMTANLHYTSWESGLAKGFLEWQDYERSLRQVLRSSEIGQTQMILDVIDAASWDDVLTALRRHQIFVSPKPEAPYPNASRMTDRFLAWYDGRPDRPFLAFVNYYDVHFPYAPRGAYRRKLAPEPSKRDLYLAETAYVDDELRRLFTGLRQRGALQNTYIIVTSDHGEQFGERGFDTHGNSVTTAVLHVPLIIVGPGIEPRRIDRAVSLRDIPATIAELTQANAEFPGTSLMGHLADTAFRSSPVLAWHHDYTGIRAFIDDEFHLIRRPERDELYRYRSDPQNRTDLAAADSFSVQLARLREAMTHALESAGEGPRVGNGR